MKRFILLTGLCLYVTNTGYCEAKTDQSKCLAANIYHESGTEPPLGKFGVGIVTLNRSYSKSYPNTVCAVVWDPKQFSWTEKQVKIDYGSKSWKESTMVTHALTATWKKEYRYLFPAEYFFNPDKAKASTLQWSKKKVWLATINRHSFFAEPSTMYDACYRSSVSYVVKILWVNQCSRVMEINKVAMR